MSYIEHDSVHEHDGVHLARSQHERMDALLAKFDNEVGLLGPSESHSFSNEKAEIQRIIQNRARVERERIIEQQILDYNNAERRGIREQQTLESLMVNGLSMEENVSALIQAVKDDDKSMAEKLFAECPQLDPMKDPKRHFEVIDYSDLSRPMRPPRREYGDCAFMECIRTENIDILHLLMERVPDWVANSKMDLMKHVVKCIEEDKIVSLAFILRERGYPQNQNWENPMDKTDHILQFAVRHKRTKSQFILELEKGSPGYFKKKWKKDIIPVLKHTQLYR
jgi:hypothetical protein